MVREVTFTCDNCDTEFTVSFDSEDDPSICPFCGADLEVEEDDEDGEWDD